MELLTGFFSWLPASWQYAEPVLGYGAVIGGLVYWVKVRRARRHRYANRGAKNFIIALQVGRPVSEAVKSHFGELDCLVEVNSVLGKPVLESERDYERLARELYRAMAANQHCPIKLTLSGPVGLSFLIGQLVGLAKFDVEIFQFDSTSKSYQSLPIPDRHWLS